jgi:trehalose-phosphatase
VRGVEAALAAWHGRPRDRHAVLLLDFDGTLAEFEDDPAAVRLAPSRQALLQAMAARPDLTLGIITGRRIEDVRDRCGAGSSVFYAGLHGLEIEGPGLRFTHATATVAGPTIGVLKDELREATQAMPGVLIEDKGLSVVLHVRAASDADRLHARRRLGALAEPYVNQGVLRLQPGDQIVELLPNIDWNKGDAVRSILTHVAAQRKQRVWPVYVGDDATDEDAFEAIGTGGLTIAVTTRPAGASHRLPDPAAVEQFLRQISAVD